MKEYAVHTRVKQAGGTNEGEDDEFRMMNFKFEVVSKLQITSKDKAPIRFKSGAYTEYVSILNRIATQYLGVR